MRCLQHLLEEKPPPGHSLLQQPPVSLVPVCIISSLCYPQPPLSRVSYKHRVLRALQEAFLSSSMAEERWCFQFPLPAGSLIVPQGGRRKRLFISRGSKCERGAEGNSEWGIHWMSHDNPAWKLVLQEKKAKSRKKNHVGKHWETEKCSISSSNLLVAHFYVISLWIQHTY